MKFMNEKSPICSATSEICPARQMLVEAIEISEKSLTLNESIEDLRPQERNSRQEKVAIGQKILSEAGVNCFGDECMVARKLVNTLFNRI